MGWCDRVTMHKFTLFLFWVCHWGWLYLRSRCFNLPVVNQMILAGTLLTLLPPSSAEYTLIELYVPFGVFLLFLVRDVATGRVAFSQRHMLIMLILFALLFSPLTFFGRYAGDFQMLLLAGILLTARSYRMPSSIFGELKSELAGLEPAITPG